MAEVSNETKIAVSDLDLHYGAFHALHGITMDMPRNQITAFIGPSGCGKSTFLRCLNRMNDTIEAAESRVQSSSTVKSSIAKKPMSTCSASALAWCSKRRTRSL